ncbi:MAG: antitoxin [Acidobacteria bacterium]|nr:antitoxin [Acidobacteriota bacterium]MBV9147307.1 antitoxin [Acidobacteriota bacterium]MBV9436582.1 antitoxin [Acidobacteriota bacterium]
MRTTLSIDDDALRLAQEYAETRSLALGKAVSELLRKGASHKWGMREEDGLYVVDLPADAPRVTTKHTLALEDEL